ncbi:hypothetical protein D3C73_1663250 [compost metagenome]
MTPISWLISSFSLMIAEVRLTISTKSPPDRLQVVKTSAKLLMSSSSARRLKS